MEILLPPNSNTLQVTSDIIDNADAITADTQQMSLLPTNTQDTNVAVYEEVIDQLYDKADEKTVTVNDIVKSVAKHFNLSKEDAKSTKKLIKKRLMYLIEQSNVVNGINNNSRHTLTQEEGSADDDKQPSISTLTEGVTLAENLTEGRAILDNHFNTLTVAPRLLLEHITPKILTTEMIKNVFFDFDKTEEVDKNLWKNLTGGNKKRKWISDLHDGDKRLGLRMMIEEALEGYIKIVQEKYPELKYYKVGAIKSLPGAPSQYDGHGRKLHSDYPQSVEELEPKLRPVSIIVGLNPSNFMWLPHITSRQTEISEMTVKAGEMIIFTNNCLHAGGANNTNEEQTRLFAYLASDESHFPSGTVTTWDWQQHSADPLITKPFNSYNALINLSTINHTRMKLGTGRFATIATLTQDETEEVNI